MAASAFTPIPKPRSRSTRPPNSSPSGWHRLASRSSAALLEPASSAPCADWRRGVARLRSGPIWTRCTSTSKTRSPMPRSSPGGCMPAVTTATPRCCSAPRSTSPRRAISPARSISSFSRPRRTRAAARVMVEEGVFEQVIRSTRSMACTTGRNCRSGEFAIQPGPMMAAFDIFEITINGRGGARGDAASRGRSDRSPRRRSSTACRRSPAATPIRSKAPSSA